MTNHSELQLTIKQTWREASTSVWGIIHGKENDDDFGFVEMQPGFADGHGLIFLKVTQNDSLGKKGINGSHLRKQITETN